MTHSASTMTRQLSIVYPCPHELQDGLQEIEKAFPERFTPNTTGWEIVFRKGDESNPSVTVDIDSNTIQIVYSQIPSAFRALGIIMGQLASENEPEPISESSQFESIGVMLDVSRNGVLRLESIRKFIRHFSLMGINQVMLYTEDTFEIPSEPLFGYFRGGYSQVELRSIDQYAADFGIEVIPCIQTLGHLEQVLQWPAFRELKDTHSVLLAGDANTNDFIEKMICAASAPFRSKRIHIGMDEAHGIGSGIYRLKNGLRAPFDILCEHLQRTVATCQKHGLKPMIWSDMFFRLNSKTNQYYDKDSHFEASLGDKIPQDVQLVYWDYYHSDSSFYDEWTTRHRQLGKEPIFAAGIWTWQRFWAQLPYSITTLKAGISSARRQKLREVFVTMWGDDGMECDIFSALPAVQVFADMSYGYDIHDDERHTSNFLGSVNGSYNHWLLGSELDRIPVESEEYEANASKWLLWHDPLLGHLEAQILPEYLSHYKKVSEALECISFDQGEDKRCLFIKQAAQILTLKVELHLTLREAYKLRDMNALQHIDATLIKPLIEEFSTLRDIHEVMWHTNCTYHGWDVLERRYAGILARLESLHKKIAMFLSGQTDCIEELQSQPLTLWPKEQTQSMTISHRQAITPTVIA